MFIVSPERNSFISETREKTREMSRENTREKIIAAILDDSSITTAKLAEMLNISEKGVEYQLNKLKKENIISRIGSDNGGYWQIMKNK